MVTEMLKKLNIPVVPYDEYSYKPIRSQSVVDGERDTFNVLYPLMPTHSYLVTKKDKLQEIDLMNYGTNTYRAFMNNTRYPDMLCDFMPDMNGKRMSRVTMSFVGEAALGRVLTVLRGEQDGVYYFRTVDGDRVCLEAEVEVVEI